MSYWNAVAIFLSKILPLKYPKFIFLNDESNTTIRWAHCIASYLFSIVIRIMCLSLNAENIVDYDKYESFIFVFVIWPITHCVLSLLAAWIVYVKYNCYFDKKKH